LILFGALLLITSDPLPYPLVRELDDVPVTKDGARLGRPTDALYVDGTLFVSDGSDFCVFALNSEGTLTRFGRAGSGPGEFQHMPTFLAVEEERIIVTEWNYLFRSEFTRFGQFLARTKRGDVYGPDAALGIRRLSWSEATDTGFMLFDKRYDCYFSRIDEDPEAGFHKSVGFVKEDSAGRLYVIKQSGIVEIYERPCEPVVSMNVPVFRFAAEIQPHNILKAIMRAAGKYTGGPVLVHGQPIFDTAVASPDQVWVLAKNEHLEKGPKFQRVRHAKPWLFEVDPTAREIRFSQQLDTPVDRIRYSGGHLIFISEYEATVQVYRIQDQ